MKNREDSSDTYTNLPDLDQVLEYLTMPTRSQLVLTDDLATGHDTSNNSYTHNIRILSKQNAILDQLI